MLPIPGRSVCRRQHLSGNCDDCKDFLRRSATRSGFRDRSICNATTDRPVVRAPSEDHLSSRPTARLNDSSAGLDSIGGSRKRGRVHAVSRRQGARCARTQRCYSIRQASMRARVAFVMRLRCHGFLCRIASGVHRRRREKTGCSLPLRWDRVFSSRVVPGNACAQATSFWSAGRRPSD